jgi:hypothetical protein
MLPLGLLSEWTTAVVFNYILKQEVITDKTIKN